MGSTRPTVWKYQHDGAGHRHPLQTRVALAFLAGAVVSVAVFGFVLPGLVLTAIAVAVYTRSVKKIMVGPRRMVCGDDIVYYGNVVRMSLQEDAGVLQLETASGQRFVLSRDRFPTNARKTDKIRKNKAAKFTKVSQGLIARVLRASPDVQTTGIPDGPTAT